MIYARQAGVGKYIYYSNNCSCVMACRLCNQIEVACDNDHHPYPPPRYIGQPSYHKGM